jgi:hypothetical protein
MGSRGWKQSIRRERAWIRRELAAAEAAWLKANPEPEILGPPPFPGFDGFLGPPRRAPWNRSDTYGQTGTIGGRPRTNPLLGSPKDLAQEEPARHDLVDAIRRAVWRANKS